MPDSPASTTEALAVAAAGAREPRLPSLRDPGTRLVLALVALLAALSWSLQSGYQLADSVEYLERALTMVRGEEMVDAGAIRPFGFSSLILPFGLVSDALGVQASRALFWSVELLQIALTLALVLVTMRISARLAGRPAAFACGLLLAANPILLQYVVQPVSGVAAGLCVALALERLLERGGGFRAHLVPGLWLGAAFLMAYQTLLVALVVIALVAVRDRLRAGPSVAGLAAGLLAGMAVQSLLDWTTYGVFGVSVGNYLVQNFGSVLTTLLYRLGLVGLATKVYTLAGELAQEWPEVVDRSATPRQLQSPLYYLLELPHLLVWPALGLSLLGLLGALLRPRWRTLLLVGTLVGCALVMSFKGSKSFRLWLPLLPALAPLAALGFDLLRRGARPLRWIGALALVSALPLALRELDGVDQRRFGAWWRAMEWVNEHAEARADELAAVRGGPREQLVVGSAYHWAVYLREGPALRLLKLPWQLHRWDRYDAEQHAALLEALDELDLLLVHLPVLQEQPEVLDEINRRFALATAFYDQRTDTDTGPILVFERARGAPEERRLFELSGAPRLRPRPDLPEPLPFVGETPEGLRERLELVSYRYDVLPGSGLGWITYEWCTPTGLAREWTVVDRLTAPDERNAWHDAHALGWGRVSLEELGPGRCLREGFLVVAADQPYRAGAPVRPIGGGYRRGELLPVRLWLALVRWDREALARGELVETARLLPCHPGSERLLREADAHGEQRTPDGWLFSPDDLVAAGRFWMPVQPFARVPDDGRPIAD